MKPKFLILATFLILGIVAQGVNANNSLNLQLPTSYNNYSYDEVRTSDNFSCKNAISGTTNFEIGMTGIVNNAVSPFGSEDPNNPTTKDVGLYARITMPIGKIPERVNCNALYKLELHKKRLEVMKLEQELKRLKNLKFDNGKKD